VFLSIPLLSAFFLSFGLLPDQVTLFTPHTHYPSTMRSFSIAAFASLAFGLFVSAAPTGISTDVVARGVDVPTTDDKCLESILGGVVTQITPIKEEICEWLLTCGCLFYRLLTHRLFRQTQHRHGHPGCLPYPPRRS